MLHTTEITDSQTPHEIAAASEEPGAGWAPLVVAPLTLLIVGISTVANSPTDLAVAALSLLALALASVAFAAARA
jgi:hypothetical protein